MRRRDFLAITAATAALPGCVGGRRGERTTARGPGYASPKAAMKAPRETLLYTVGLYTGTDVKAPDYLAVVDVDPKSATYSQVVQRVEMPTPGDELHHFGWNACSSCHGDPDKSRRFLIVPGLASSSIHVLDAADARGPRLVKTIPGEEVIAKAKLTAPHTVHCLPDGRIMISMLGNAQGDGPGGFLLLDDEFDIAGAWENEKTGMRYNYDFWYQPRHNVMVSSEWGAPDTFNSGFRMDDVEAGKYGRQIHFWDWKARKIVQTQDLGETGLVPLEVRFHHDPASTHGFVGAALGSTMWHFHKQGARWQVDKVIEVPVVQLRPWAKPVPGLITDLVLSMDDRFLYLSNWLHGDVRQYDVSDPANPKLTGQVWCGGTIDHPPDVKDRKVTGGPQMLQLSLDGRRLYVSNSLLSSWDNQFYPDIAKYGSHIMQIDCDTQNGGMSVNEAFFVDFGKEPKGPARAHEMRFPGGDCTSDIWT